MPHYHFLTRHQDQPIAEKLEYSDDEAAIDEARRVMGEAIRAAALECFLLDDEIQVWKEDGTVVEVVVCDGSLRH